LPGINDLEAFRRWHTLTLKWIIEWYKIYKEFGINIRRNQFANIALIFTGEMKKYDIPKDRLKSYRKAVIMHNLIYTPGFLIVLYIVLNMKK
jgi:hypothetical protein